MTDEEKASVVLSKLYCMQKGKITAEIDNELKLLEDAIGAAFSSGDMMKFAEATMKLNAYKDRHITAANKKIHELTEENNAVKEDK